MAFKSPMEQYEDDDISWMTYCRMVQRTFIDSYKHSRKNKEKKIKFLYPLNLYSKMYLTTDIKDFVKFLTLHGDNGRYAILELMDTFDSVVPVILSKEEAQVIFERYKYGKTLAAVGNLLGVGPERIRRIEEKAIRKLRHPRIHVLIEFGIHDCDRIYKAYGLFQIEREERISKYDMYKS